MFIKVQHSAGAFSCCMEKTQNILSNINTKKHLLTLFSFFFFLDFDFFFFFLCFFPLSDSELEDDSVSSDELLVLEECLCLDFFLFFFLLFRLFSPSSSEFELVLDESVDSLRLDFLFFFDLIVFICQVIKVILRNIYTSIFFTFI